MNDLNYYRDEIDKIDPQIVELLEKRFNITRQIGEYKAENGKELFCPEREKEKLDGLRVKIGQDEYCDYILDVFGFIMDSSKSQQSNNIFGTDDIYLIGMPGCGKSSVGKLLAEKLQRSFIDLDELFEKHFRVTPADMIVNEGENVFRTRETELLRLVAGDRDMKAFKNDYLRIIPVSTGGRVISCGGGIVVRDENLDIMKGNSCIIYIKRKLENLATAGRPLSAQNGTERLFESRREKYLSFSDIEVENDSTVEACVAKITEMLNRFRTK